MFGMRRRELITLLGGATAAWPLAARGQQLGKVARIGFLRYASPHAKQFEAFRDGLRASGYVEGQNIVIEQRYADGAFDRLGELAAELVRLNLDVIVVDGSVTAKAVKTATSAVPVVFSLASDPSRMAVLIQPNNLTADSYLQDVERVGRALGLSTRPFAARDVEDLPRAFAAMVEWQANGLVTLNDAFFLASVSAWSH
jgi:hypothetical protein